jgi:hypothetical protein
MRVGNGVKEVVVDDKRDALVVGVAVERRLWRVGRFLQ